MPRCRIVDDDLESKAENWEFFQISSIKAEKVRYSTLSMGKTFLMNSRRDPCFHKFYGIMWDDYNLLKGTKTCGRQASMKRRGMYRRLRLKTYIPFWSTQDLPRIRH
jgi:hypothetical protein